MKKLFKVLAICCLSVLFLGACGGKEKPIQVTGQNGVVYESYQEACSAQDFVAAHMFLDRMKAEASMMSDKTRKEREKKVEAERKIEEAVGYITNKEILLLMSLDDKTAFDRITFLIKENDVSDSKNDEFCDMVIDLALDMDKPELVKRMTNFYKSNMSDRILRKIVEKLYINKEDENFDFVSMLLNRYDKNEILLNAAIEKGDENLVVEMAQSQSGTLSFTTFKKLMDFLSSHNNPKYQSLFEQLSISISEKDELINYAISCDNEKVVVNVAKQCENLSLATFKKIMDFLSSHNNPKYQSLFEQLSTKVSDIDGLLDYAIEKNQKNVAKNLLQNYKLLTIDNKEMISKLASINDKQYSDVILLALAETAKSVPSRPSIQGYVKTYYEYMERTDHGKYNEAVKDYNKECFSILNIAISNKNLYLAKNVISKMKQGFAFQEIGDWAHVVEKEYDVYSAYIAWKVSLSNEDINEAKRILDDAIKNGSFK